MKKICVQIYFVWFITSFIYSIVIGHAEWAGRVYFIANMVVLGCMNIILIRYILKEAQRKDPTNYNTISQFLLTRTGGDTVFSESKDVQKLINDYKSLTKYSLMDVVVLLVVEFICLLQQ